MTFLCLLCICLRKDYVSGHSGKTPQLGKLKSCKVRQSRVRGKLLPEKGGLLYRFLREQNEPVKEEIQRIFLFLQQINEFLCTKKICLFQRIHNCLQQTSILRTQQQDTYLIFSVTCPRNKGVLKHIFLARREKVNPR